MLFKVKATNFKKKENTIAVAQKWTQTGATGSPGTVWADDL